MAASLGSPGPFVRSGGSVAASDAGRREPEGRNAAHGQVAVGAEMVEQGARDDGGRADQHAGIKGGVQALAAEALSGGLRRSTSCREAMKVEVKLRACSPCSGNSSHTGGEKAKAVQRDERADPAEDQKAIWPPSAAATARRTRGTATSTPTPDAPEEADQGRGLNPWARQISAEKL